ncbi:MAG TPA: hypothetical protein VJY34_22270 [Roseiarcus sp.]|nr:hypothetical protein [Roseiarcus sp.]
MTDKTIAIVGAGPGLGLSLAHGFGREGFRVALIARPEAFINHLPPGMIELDLG